MIRRIPIRCTQPRCGTLVAILFPERGILQLQLKHHGQPHLIEIPVADLVEASAGKPDIYDFIRTQQG